MEPTTRERISRLLAESAPGAASADAGALVPLVYDELRALAHRYFRDERPDHTLQPTAVVHEAYLRLVDETRVNWQGRTHFRAVCAKVMRRVLIDHARTRNRTRRGGGQKPLALESQAAPLDLGAVDAVVLHDAIEQLATLDPIQARIVELRFFGGLSVDEVAQTLKLAKRTVEAEWTHAKAWLRTQLDAGADA